MVRARIGRVMFCAYTTGIWLYSSVAAAQSTSPNSAGASQTDPMLTEVIVTATKREQSIQTVPFTVTALDEHDLVARGASSVEQAINYVPGVSFSSNGANSGSYAIRGVSTSSSVANAQSPVALYIDDMDILDPTYPKVTTNLRLFDVSRVEVLEGPQGTLFGSGSLGGAIRVITNKPDLESYQAETQETVSHTDGGAASYDLNAMVNLPLITDILALRVVGYYQHDGGYIDNVTRAEPDANYATSQGGRVELKWVPMSNLSLLASVLLEDDVPHDSAYSDYGSRSYTWNGAVPNFNYNNTKIYSLTGIYDSAWASVTSITTYADRFENAAADFTQDAVKLLGISNPSPIYDEGPSRSFSQEVRFASASSQPFRWLIGGIYINNQRTVDENVYVPGSQAIFGGTSDVISAADTRNRTREQAVFGELSYDLLQQLAVTVGARVNDDRLILQQTIGGTAQIPSAVYNDTTERATTPKYNLSYRFTPSLMVYAQAAEGYRIGQVNTVTRDPVSGQPIPLAANPDRLWNYELGEKSTFLDNRLIVNAAVYYIDWRDIQLNELTLASGINYIANAGKADIKGAELEIKSRLSTQWELGGSLSLNDAHLETVNPTVAATPGDWLPGSARENVVLYSQYTRQVVSNTNVFGRVDARYVGKEFADLDNSTSLTYGSYTNVNLRGGIQWPHYALTLFIDNVTNGSRAESAFPSLGFPVAIRQRPLTVGITFDARL